MLQSIKTVTYSMYIFKLPSFTTDNAVFTTPCMISITDFPMIPQKEIPNEVTNTT